MGLLQMEFQNNMGKKVRWVAECVASTWLADKSKMTLALASDLEHPDPSGGLLGGWLSECRIDSQPHPVSFSSSPDDFLSYPAPFINPFLLNTN